MYLFLFCFCISALTLTSIIRILSIKEMIATGIYLGIMIVSMINAHDQLHNYAILLWISAVYVSLELIYYSTKLITQRCV